MRSLAFAAVLIPLFSCLVACGGGTMRVVQETPSGGTVAVQGDDGSTEKAEKYMGAQCPFGYDILGRQRTPDDQQTIRYSCRLPARPDAERREVKEVAVHI